MSKPLLSVIIPCFNGGLYLREAVESVTSLNDDRVNIIIVDDGSTEGQTLGLLEQLKQEDHKIIRQENSGPAAARNTGIKSTTAPYIFFLDSDNRVRSGYLDKGIEILESQPEVGVFYGCPNFIGAEKKQRFVARAFDPYLLVLINYIDMCTVVRRSAWEEVGGLDENRIIMGMEDWDFWIRLAGAGWKFHFSDNIYFDYRIRQGSLSETSLKQEGQDYIFNKNATIIKKCYSELYQKVTYQREQKNPYRRFIMNMYSRLIDKR